MQPTCDAATSSIPRAHESPILPNRSPYRRVHRRWGRARATTARKRPSRRPPPRACAPPTGGRRGPPPSVSSEPALAGLALDGGTALASAMRAAWRLALEQLCLEIKAPNFAPGCPAGPSSVARLRIRPSRCAVCQHLMTAVLSSLTCSRSSIKAASTLILVACS